MSSTLVFNVSGTSVPAFTDMAAFEAAGGVTINPGPAWIGGFQYGSNLVSQAENSTMFNGGAVRIVKNKIPFDKTDLDAWTEINTNGAFSYVGTSPNAKKCICTAISATARVCLALTISVTAGKKYAARCKIENIVGTPASIIWTDSGASNSQATITSDGYVGIVWTADLTESANLRVGLNPGGAAGNSGDSVTISEIMWEEIPSTQTVPSEYVPPSNGASFKYPISNTLVSGRVTDVVGTTNALSKSRTVLVMGDSLTNNSNEFPDLLFQNRPDFGIAVYGRPGARGIDSLNLVTQSINLVDLLRVGDASQTEIVTPLFNSNVDKPAVLVWEFGINDILQSSDSFGLAEMQAIIYTVKQAAESAGVKLIVFDATPCVGNPNATSDRLLLREQYNAWISTLKNTSSFRVFQISRILGSSTTFTYRPYDTLQTTYDTVGDGLHIHPGATGHQAIANALSAILV